MLRIHFIQHWFTLADLACEEALYDSASLRRFHDGLILLQLVDVEVGHAIAVFGRMIEYLAKGNEGHENFPGL